MAKHDRVTSREFVKWPETQALLKRLGLLDLDRQHTTISFGVQTLVRVEVVLIGSDVNEGNQ